VVGAERVLDRTGDGAHRRLMEHDVDAAAGRLDRAQVTDIALDNFEVRGVSPADLEVGPTPRREIVEDADPMTIGEETSGDVGADEPGAAGDQTRTVHRCIIARGSRLS